jgi:hypothetical protein
MRTFIYGLSSKSVTEARKRGVSSYFLCLPLSSKPCPQPFPPLTHFKPGASAWPDLQPAVSSVAAANRFAVTGILSYDLPVPPWALGFRCSWTLCCGSSLYSAQGSNLGNPPVGSPGNSLICCTRLRVRSSGKYCQMSNRRLYMHTIADIPFFLRVLAAWTVPSRLGIEPSRVDRVLPMTPDRHPDVTRADRPSS